MKKKTAALILTFILFTQLVPRVQAQTDNLIYSDPIANTYQGRSEAPDIINNIRFTDVPTDHAARESIVQGGALNLIKGFERHFSPDAIVSKQDALALLMRAIGRENEAIALGAERMALEPPDSPLHNLWALGYLELSTQLGIISDINLADSLEPDQSVLNPSTNFVRTSPVSRQQFAAWIYDAMRTANPTAFDTTRTTQSIFAYTDWQNIDADKALAVEAMLANNIMSGANGVFDPDGSVTKADAAQTLKNLDSIYFTSMNIERIRGTVGGARNNQYTETGYAGVWRDLYIRRADGKIDVIQYPMEVSSSPQSMTKDVVVYKNDAISGLADLKEGDLVEYLADTFRNEVLYIKVTGQTASQNVTGILHAIDFDNRMISLLDSSGKNFQYAVSEGLMFTENDKNYIYFDRLGREISTLRYGSRYTLTLTNNVTTDIKYVGESVLVSEVSGVVVENNPNFGYLTIARSDGNVASYQYYENDMQVKKRQYYDLMDEIGYIDRIFPNYQYNSMNTVISDIEPGDIVFLTLDRQDPNVIDSISASTDYVMKYGKIMRITPTEDYWQILVEYENKRTAWYDIASTTFVSADGRPVAFHTAKPGDWVKLLVNQAVITPGYIMESIKEVVIEGDEHFISSILKGQLSGLNQIQNTLTLQNVQTLAKTGWSDYHQVQSFSLSGRDIEYYHNNQRITLDYAIKFLKRSEGEVYVALENNFAGERIKKVTFRDGRDEILNPDTIISSDGVGNFRVLSSSGTISTDSGTIVRRHGRLVDGQNIMIPDYATVALNGGSNAAIVDIVDAPDTSAVTIVRGRIQSVDDGKSFTVQSMSMLSGLEWAYSPIQREFTIDYDTLFLNDAGYVDPSTFLSYTDDSVVDKVYTIVVDGSRAARVVEAPYSTYAVRGTIYAVTDAAISLKDVTYYENDTGRWRTISNTNSIAEVTVQSNAIIAKSNAITQINGLQIGDQLRVMTNELPDEITGGMTIAGYIIYVEK